jgi:ubiquinone/menaquinone biosynthesis C-methylase UbiE
MDYYSEIAAGYNELHGQEQYEKLQEFLEKLALRGITLHGKLLDIGCGAGRSARLLAVDWHGIEPSVGLRAQADELIIKKIVIGKGEQLPWQDQEFDVILSLTALQNYDTPREGLAEIRRVAKQEAVILISFIKKSAKRDLLDRMIHANFIVLDFWEQSKDCMYICKQL